MPEHNDDELRDGNLTDDEYEATYADGPWCGPSPDEVARIERELKSDG